jgi:hypothetical protein
VRIGWLMVAIVTVAGCTVSSGAPSAETIATPIPIVTSPTIEPSPSPTPRTLALGEALPAVASPSATTCDRLLRADIESARRIRAGLADDGVAGDDARLAAAAADPAADLTQLGIPLLPDDIAALRTAGFWIDGKTPIISWVSTGRQDLFGGAWIDAAKSQSSVVVSVVDGDPAAHELARCLERPDIETRYVNAERSQADLHAIQASIEADRDTLPDEGIRLIGTAQLPDENVVEVGVQGLTDEIATKLIERYGEGIRMVDDRPSVLD